ncbi:MAG: ATP-dependent helicase, partial [Bacillota bacterium]
MKHLTSDVRVRLLADLSEEQRRAVCARERYVRVVAAAGAGKTETLTRRILYLLAAGADPRSIVAFTFTEKAAAEMKERLYQRGGELLPADVVNRLGEMYVGTIHGFCARLLQDFFGYGNQTVLDENQEVAFLMRHGWGLGLQELEGRYSDNCLRFLESLGVVCNEGLCLKDVARCADPADPAGAGFAGRVRSYWELLDRHRLLTFGLLIRLAVENLEGNRLTLPYRHVIVDEFQDINRAQEQLISHLAERAETCFVVGDPRQCIYEWRGSDPACFERFARAFGAGEYPLTVNRRSARAVIQVANRVAERFEASELRSPMDYLPDAPPGQAFHLACATPADEADYIADAIRALVDRAVCRYGDVAVLLRSVSTSGPEFTRAFRERNIPYLVLGKIGLFRRPEAEALACLFVWCAGLSWWRSAVERYEGDRLLDRARQLWPGGIADGPPQAFRDSLVDGRYGDLIEAYYDLLAQLGVHTWDPEDSEAAVRLANLGRFSKVIGDFQAAYWRGARRPSPGSVVSGLAWYLIGYATGGYAEQLPDPIPDADAVYLGTVHQAKGLEWPVVFVPALVAGRFPSSKAGSEREWLVSPRLFDASRYEGGRDAERKLFYVAVTRARDVLVFSRFRGIARSRRPSPFLDEVGLPAAMARPGEGFPSVRVRPRRAEEEPL